MIMAPAKNSGDGAWLLDRHIADAGLLIRDDRRDEDPLSRLA